MTTCKIAFATHLAEIINHYRPIIRNLPVTADIISCAPVESGEHIRIQKLGEAENCPVHHISTLTNDEPHYDILVSHHLYVTTWTNGKPDILKLARKHARLSYGLGKTEWNLSDWNSYYDLILCFGPYQKKLFQHAFPSVSVESVGYPRFDAFFDPDFDKNAMVKSLGGNPERLNVIWLPTYSTLSSIDDFAVRISELTEHYNVFVKLHPGTPALEPNRMELLSKCHFTKLIVDEFDNVSLFQIADYVLADYGGSPFGAIYTDKNLLLLNKSGDLYAEDTCWLSADIQLREHFVNLCPEDSKSLLSIISNPDIWEEQKAVREIYRKNLFSEFKDQSGQKAAEQIMECINTRKRELNVQTARQDVSDELLRILPNNTLNTNYSYPWKSIYHWTKQKIMTLTVSLESLQSECEALKLASVTLNTGSSLGPTHEKYS